MKKLSEHVRLRRRYLRSVNLERDYEMPQSLDGYILTQRGASFLESILDGYKTPLSSRAWTLTGVYGTGKSAFANFVLALMASKDNALREHASKILKVGVNNELSRRAARAFPNEGLVRAVAVARREPVAHTVIRAVARGAEKFWSNRAGPKPASVHAILRLEAEIAAGAIVQPIDLPQLVREVSIASGTGLVLVIDELGKTLEFAAASRGAFDLFLLQQLAELERNPGDPPVILIGLLHQAFSEYGQGLSSGERAEWDKIQGRFEDIAFAESPEQMLRLIGSAIERDLPKSVSGAVSRESKLWSARFAKRFSHPYLRDILPADLVESVFPLHPISAVALPALCLRFGQNDRSLFSFLGSAFSGLAQFLDEESVDDRHLPTLRLPSLYDYFLSTASGGANQLQVHRWSEIHSAIAGAAGSDNDELDVLKTIGTLNLIGSSGPIRASRELVLAALMDRADNAEQEHRWGAAIERLAARKVLTYRQQIDEYRIWEGSDFDIDDAVRNRLSAQGDSLAQILAELSPLGPVVAQRHSYETGTLRFFERRYASSVEALTAERTSRNADGVIGYWLGADALENAPPTTRDNRPLVVVDIGVPRSLERAARELHALSEVADKEIALQNDGVARREVRYRISIAREVLDRVLEETLAGGVRCVWFQGQRAETPHFNGELSRTCNSVYSQTPVLWNELINKNELSSQGARAQRELIAALLTRSAEPRFGLEGNGPEASIYESVFKSTGMHRSHEGEWAILPPLQQGILPLWNATEEFCLGAVDSARPLSDLYALLDAPPFGAKRGLIPVLLAAVLQYHADDLSIYQDGSFLPVLGPAHFELLVKNPARFSVKHFALRGLRWEVFRELETLLKTGGAKRSRNTRNATLLTVARPLVRFATGLPLVTRIAKDLPAQTAAVRDALLDSREPDLLLFEALPRALGFSEFGISEESSSNQHELFRKALFNALRDLQGYYERLLESCRYHLHAAFGVRSSLTHVREDLRVRSSYLSGSILEPRLRGFVQAAVEESRSETEWLESVVMIVADRPASSWSSEDLAAFEINLSELARRFINLEALRAEVARDAIEGFDARRVTVTRPTGEEVHRLIWVGKAERSSIENLADSMYRDIGVHAKEERLQHAILMALIERMLTPTPHDELSEPQVAKQERKRG